ncbi:MAG: transporter [Gammaproteobacteria bacterium]|jgi:MHS family proline/betaine transporter-like MFS transporter|nr:transporter [Gammaproteobacteria bacterium]
MAIASTSKYPISNKLLLGCLIGVFLEYFDYTLYGFSAPFIAHLFFPKENPALAFILTWGIFSVSFLVRPFGAAIFGHFADKIGRRSVLSLTIIMMSVATLALGLLPTYQSIGNWAAILLLLCRIFQGLSVSTEYTGASVYVLEFETKFKGLYSGIITSASGYGVFAASLLVMLFNSAGASHFFSAGLAWRMPFLIAGLLAASLGVYLRRNLTETPIFIELKAKQSILKQPVKVLLKSCLPLLLMTTFICSYVGTAIIGVEVYLPSYLQLHLNIGRDTALGLSTYTALLEASCAILLGYCSDFLGRKKAMQIAAILMIVLAVPAFKLLETKLIGNCYIAVSLLAIAVAAIDGPIAAFLVESFPAAVRYTGVSLSYSLGLAMMGGLSPMLMEWGQNHVKAVAFPAAFLIMTACVMILILNLLPKQKNKL